MFGRRCEYGNFDDERKIDFRDRHLARDELESIMEDAWDEDIWGIEHEDSSSTTDIPKLIFYFGENVSLPNST